MTGEETFKRLFPATFPYDGHCLMCKWGYPILFGDDAPTDTWACGKHTVCGLKSKKLTAPEIDKKRYELGRSYVPLMVWDESCDGFKFVEINSRKWKWLGACGLFDDKEAGDGTD